MKSMVPNVSILNRFFSIGIRAFNKLYFIRIVLIGKGMIVFKLIAFQSKANTRMEAEFRLSNSEITLIIDIDGPGAPKRGFK